MHKIFAALFIATLCTIPQIGHAAPSDFIPRAIQALIPEAPEMVTIARCESGLRQYTDSGSVLRGGLGGQMIGLFQFHEKYHRSTAQTSGHNIDTLLGNIMYARELYRAQGTTPWNSSAHCWQSELTASPISTQTTTPTKITQSLRYGSNHGEVKLLKDVLVAQGFLPAASLGVRNAFDLATLKALIAFQCKETIACHTGTAPRTGLGRVNDTTRERLNTYLAAETLALQ